MHLLIRPATSDDGATIVRFLDAAYGGGYSPTFDRDGPLQPRDLWWVQSEKSISVIEVNRQPAGVLVVGRVGGQWLVEELLLPGLGEHPGRTQEALVARTTQHLTGLFQHGRQDTLLLRVAEANAFGLAVALHARATFTNALLVYRYRGARRPAAAPPEGYQVRRSTPEDARAVSRLARDVDPQRSRADEFERVLSARGGRGFVAIRDGVLVGYAVSETRAGRGDWTVGVDGRHRRRGVGRALAAAVLGAMHGRAAPPLATAWALDPSVGAFLRAIGFGVERTFLYLERAL
ncbi:MAG: GNAT family N-acetyltransferase [Armatimonadota bacterium]|nr:GNAT family N-acetyltransferase [Armatimonadota bacterium]